VLRNRRGPAIRAREQPWTQLAAGQFLARLACRPAAATFALLAYSGAGADVLVDHLGRSQDDSGVIQTNWVDGKKKPTI